MLVEGQLVDAVFELIELGAGLVGEILHHGVEALASAAVGAAESHGGGAEACACDGGDHGEAFIEGSGVESAFTKARGAGDDELGFVDGGVGFEIVDNAGCAPAPGADEAPIVVGISGEEAGGAVSPGAVGEAEASIFAAITVIEGDVGETVEDRGIVGGKGLGVIGAKASEAASTSSPSTVLGQHLRLGWMPP